MTNIVTLRKEGSQRSFGKSKRSVDMKSRNLVSAKMYRSSHDFKKAPKPPKTSSDVGNMFLANGFFLFPESKPV